MSERLAAEEPPLDSLMDTAEIGVRRPAARPLLLIVVMASTLCLCMMLVSLAGFAGYRDGLATNDAKVTQTLATGIAEQYATGVADLQQGHAEMAVARFAWIVETIQAPTQYALDSPGQLALARTIEAYSPTPSPAPTRTLAPTFTPTSPPTLTPSVEPTATLPPMQDPAYLYDQAALAMQVTHYEEAISWLDALRALAPDYRAAEGRAMLIEALTKQGRIYLRGQNTDGEDMLARGVLLIYRADELGPVEPPDLLGEANFVEMYINARNYVTGGDYARALPVLEELCRINCGWSYHGASVQDLLDSAQAGGSTP
jgi:tetratricopeptide (TPR) repeat protein